MKNLSWIVSVAVLTLACHCSVGQELKQLLPGLWVEEGVVEFDAKIAMDCHHPDTPDVYLEMFICGPDSREHESLLVTQVLPSSLHAGLLAAGITPGGPVSYVQDEESGRVKRIAAYGDPVRLEVHMGDPKEDSGMTSGWISILDWAVHVENEVLLSEEPRWDGFVFAGSVLDEGIARGPKYGADREGSHVSLTAFGHEVISPVWIVSPDAGVDEPVWIANRDLVPEFGSAVRVRITRTVENEEDDDGEILEMRTDDSHQPDGIHIDDR
ncbi:MAG: YdjY domain-containing protein [Phycisphaerales bacterium]